MDIVGFFWIMVLIVLFLSHYLENSDDEQVNDPWRGQGGRARRKRIIDAEIAPIKLTGEHRGHEWTINTAHQRAGEKGIFSLITLRRCEPLTPITPQQDIPRFVEDSIDRLAMIVFPQQPLPQSYVPLAELRFSTVNQLIIYEQPNLGSDSDSLNRLLDPLIDILQIYLGISRLGGLAMVPLGKIIDQRGLAIPQTAPSLLQQITTSLVDGIARQTGDQCANRVTNLLCPECLTRFDTHTLRLSPLKSVTYYGCRLCHQSNDFLEGPVMVVLNQPMKTPYLERDETVYLNWLNLRRPCDFNGVYIGQATDEDIERFAVQVGNDTDPRRRTRYPKIPCTISAKTQLSSNSRRILERTFGEITVV